MQCPPYPLNCTAGSKFCPFCEVGFYLDSTNANVGTQTLVKTPLDFCLECPSIEVDCNRLNTTLDDLPVRIGFWRDSYNTATLYSCHINACVGHQPTHNHRHLRQVITSSDIYCAVNHTGPLCQVCINSSSDYFDPSKMGSCATCPSPSKLFLRVFIALAIAMVAIVMSWLFMRRLSTFSVILTSLRLQAKKVKILVGFCQVISSFRAVHGVSIHDKLKAWFNCSTFTVIASPIGLYTRREIPYQ